MRPKEAVKKRNLFRFHSQEAIVSILGINFTDMIVDRLKNILKANINAQWEKLDGNDFNIWKTYFEENEAPAGQPEDARKAEEEWEQYRQQQQHRQEQQHTAANQQARQEAQYYADLELPVGAPFADVKKAYRRMVKLYHPDLFQHDAKKQDIAKEVTRKINEAYEYFEKKYGK
jgi:uncharacterized protein with LGFP repeats